MSSDRVNARSNNSSELLRLAKEEFGNLTKAEEWLFEKVSNGDIAYYSDKRDEESVEVFYKHDSTAKSVRVKPLTNEEIASWRI